MIDNYKQLTGKYLRANKKRSLLTIIGIILSVALVSTIGLFFKGMQDSQIKYYKKITGAAQLMYTKPNAKLISEIQNNPKVSRSGLYVEGEEFKVNEKISGCEITATDKALELLPSGTKKGRMPKNEKEVALESWALSKINRTAKVGSIININNKQYTLVGILEDNSQSQADNKVYVYTKNNSINIQNANLLVEISSKTNLTKAVKQLKNLADKNSVKENTYVLSLEGYHDGSSATNGIFIIIGIVIGIVVISTIAVIYNSFQISVVERIRQFGLLRAVGSTKKQIRKIVVREATILAAIGIPIGLLLSVIAAYTIGVIFKILGGSEISFITMNPSPKILAASAALGLITIYISALLPAYFASRVSPLYAISGRMAIVKENIKKRKGSIVQKLFGFEGAMAYKNIKRNRRRYRITVFSMVISIVLFITFKSLMDMTLTLNKQTNETSKKDFTISLDKNNDKDTISDSIVNKVKNLPTVKKVCGINQSYNFNMAIENSDKISKIKKSWGVYKQVTVNGKDMTSLNSSINVYDVESIEASKKYLKSGNINIDKLNKENGVILIDKNEVDHGSKAYIGPVSDLKVGDVVLLQYNSDFNKSIQFGKGNLEKVKIMAILKDDPFDFQGQQSGLKIITTEELAKKLTGQNTINRNSINIRINNKKDEKAAKNQIEDAINNYSNLTLINNIDQNKDFNSAVLIMKILLYGFVLVISLIGSINIVNTLTTNIILRKREFATLKSIGLTQKGLRKMIVFEGVIYGIFGTIYGSIIGSGLSYFFYHAVGGYKEMLWNVPWNSILIAGACSLLIGYVSVLSPLARIKKDNLIESVRQDF